MGEISFTFGRLSIKDDFAPINAGIQTLEKRFEKSTKHMEESLDEIKGLYKSLTPKTGVPCAYCNALATDKEHVTPISWIEKSQDLYDMGINIVVPKEKIVPSCRECNLIAMDRIFDNFQDKKMYIRWKLAKKYRKWLDREQWDDEELEGLSGNFRRRVTLYNEVLKAVHGRLKHINARMILKHKDYFSKKYG